MNIEQILQQIGDQSVHDRDIIIDDLGDAISGNMVERSISGNIVVELIRLAQHETDEAVHESIMNLLSSYYEPLGDRSLEIEEFVVEHIGNFEVGSLLQALSIVAELPNGSRYNILAFYAQSELEIVRETASRCLALN